MSVELSRQLGVASLCGVSVRHWIICQVQQAVVSMGISNVSILSMMGGVHQALHAGASTTLADLRWMQFPRELDCSQQAISVFLCSWPT